MPDPYGIYLSSLHKFARKYVRKLKSLFKIKRRKRRKPKRLFSEEFNCLASSFASMEVTNQLKQVFEFFDANGDGKISNLEITEVLLRLGHEKSMAKKEAEEMVREMDRDGDGLVDMDEFMSVVAKGDGESGRSVAGGGEEDELMDAFLVFDSDKNGFISAKELQTVMAGLGIDEFSLRECRRMIKAVDKDGDGLVDFEEFKSMMTL